MTIVVLGPGGVGGLLAGALEQAGEPVAVVGRESTVQAIAADGLQVSSATLGTFTARVDARSSWSEPLETLIVATKAIGLSEALERIETGPRLVLPLLNGLDHIQVLRERFGREAVVAGTIRVEADRPRPGVIVHTSGFLRIEMASAFRSAVAPMAALAGSLERAGAQVRVLEPASAAAEVRVMWSKLVRLNALACMTSAYDVPLGEIRADAGLRGELVRVIEESCAVARAEGADGDPAQALAELEQAHASLGSSMQRDIAAGRTPELDAIPGSVLRAAARDGLMCPTIEGLVAMIAARAGLARPVAG